MGIITKMLKQTAVYWAPSGADEYGIPTWATPVEISCRWEDSTAEFTDADGERKMSKAIVYVSQDVEERGVLLLSDLNSGIDQDNPKANDGAWEIRRFDKLPNLKVSEYLRTAYL